MEINILDASGKVTGKKAMPETIAGVKPNKHLIHEVVTAYLANQRQGTHSTLTRGEVRGGGKKPWKQKHTGRARAGTSRSPLWRGGGIIQGPKPRDYSIGIPKQKVKAALHQILSVKAQAGEIVVAEAPVMKIPKTKTITSWLKTLSMPEKVLFVTEKADPKFTLATRNLSDFKIMERRSLHPYQVMNARKIIFTPESAGLLE